MRELGRGVGRDPDSRQGALVTMLEIPPDATVDTTFECVHWRCTLAFRHCLRRQVEARRKGPRAKNRTLVPLHPFCARECDDGRIVAARFGLPSMCDEGRV
jgi:hypothetical protein